MWKKRGQLEGHAIRSGGEKCSREWLITGEGGTSMGKSG